MWIVNLVPRALNLNSRELLQKIIGDHGHVHTFTSSQNVSFPYLEFICDDALFKRMVEAGFGELTRRPGYRNGNDRMGLDRVEADAYLLLPTDASSLLKPVVAEFGDIAHQTRSISPHSDIVLGRQPTDGHVASVEAELLFSHTLVGFFAAYGVSFCSGKVLVDQTSKVLPFRRVEKKNPLGALASSSYVTVDCPICGEGFKHFRFPLLSENFEFEDFDFCGFSETFEGHLGDSEGIRQFVVSPSIAASLRTRFRRQPLNLLPFAAREDSVKGRRMVAFEEMLLSVGFSW